MNVFLIGSGGREHALAWKIAQSPLLEKLTIAPGNAGTSSLGSNLPLDTEDTDGLVEYSRKHKPDLIVIGPEAPLAAGLSDRLREAGLRVFGPSQAAARLEYSKSFAKDFLVRCGIPTARHQTFSEYSEAKLFLKSVDYPVVIKASGLAAGKGVLLPETMEEAERAVRTVMLDRAFGDAGSTCVIEERLEGEEVSLLGFCDGNTVRMMPPAQDHKRVFEGDQGPNTGGMGAYAPAPVCPPEKAAEWTDAFLQKAVDGMRNEGVPYAGVLYAGVILTKNGPFVLEYNCRFGDPETQVTLPLLETDLLQIFTACTEGRLAGVPVQWKQGAAACVVMASEGYPGAYAKGRTIHGLDSTFTDSVVFHAGTRTAPDGTIQTAGGRVLCVTGWGENISAALNAAYKSVSSIQFAGMQFRKDIGWRAK